MIPRRPMPAPLAAAQFLNAAVIALAVAARTTDSNPRPEGQS